MVTMLTVFIITFIISLPIAIPVFIISLIIHFKHKKERAALGYIRDAKTAGNGPKVSKAKIPGVSLSSSAVMLLIGTALVVLSGIAFGAANWLNTSPVGRVLIILTASALSFAISYIFIKLIKLRGTSSAFYSAGSMLISVSMVIAGYYSMFGKWFSLFGNGKYTLTASAFSAAAAGFFIGWKIYHAKHFVYSGLSMAASAMLFLALQTAFINNTISFGVFSSVLIVLQALITASLYYFRFHEKTPIAKPLKMIGSVTSVVYALISLMHVVFNIAAPSISSFFILAFLMIQLIFYGISQSRTWMLVTQSILSLVLSYTLSIWIFPYNDINGLLTFSALISLSYFINRFVPKLRNPVSMTVLISAMFITSIISLYIIKTPPHVYAFILPVITFVLIVCRLFDNRTAVQTAAGIFFPVLPLNAAEHLCYMLSDENVVKLSEAHQICYGSAMLFLTAVTAFLLIIPEFTLHVKHIRKSDSVLYTNLIAVIIAAADMRITNYIFIPVAALILHFIVSNKMKNNITAVGSGIMIFVYIYGYLTDISRFSDNTLIILLFICFLIMMAISKTVYDKAVINKKDGKITFDTALLSGWILIPFMDGYSRFDDFFILISLAVLAACFVKRNTKASVSSVLFTFSVFFTAWALLSRPFLVPDNSMIANKITLAIIAFTGTAIRVIWRRYAKVSCVISNVIYAAVFSALMIDALYYENGGNTVFVLAVTTAILIVSFMIKSKVWFSVSSIAIVTIILYAAKDFLASLSGWVYLLAAGLILIGIAAINEYYKQKGENVKSKLAGVFSGWRW